MSEYDEEDIDDELDEEEIEKLKKMDKELKKDEGLDEIDKEHLEKMKKEYYKEHPKEKPYLKRKADEYKKKMKDAKDKRKRDKEIYDKAYQAEKEKSLKKRARRLAKAKYRYTPVERITGSIKQPPRQIKRAKRKIKSYNPDFGGALGSFKPGKIDYGLNMPKFNSGLGNWGGSKKTRFPEIRLDDQLGSFGKPTKKGKKKMKQIDPFEKLF